jgi:gliding motility-associated-like protein
MRFYLRKYLLITMSLFLGLTLLAQHPEKLNWKVDPFENKVFIENKGEFNSISGIPDNILFGIKGAGEQILFGRKGLYFVSLVPDNLQHRKHTQNPPIENPEEHPVLKTCIVAMNWQGEGANVQLVGEEEVPEYYNFNNSSNSGGDFHCRAYKKIRLKNLYPGIDVEYEFHAGKGIKYAIFLKPGADVSKLKMLYSGLDRISLDQQGMIHLVSTHGEMVDHAPVASDAVNKEEIASRFILKDHEVSFALAAYNPAHALVIDPWLVSPGFPIANKAYDVAVNKNTGEVFIYGGSPPYELKKLSPSGNVIWTYVSSPFGSTQTFYGDFALDPAGDVYLSNGCCSLIILKVSGSAGTLLWTSPNLYQEPWRMQFDAANNRLLVAGAFLGSSLSDNVAAVDPNSGATLNSSTIIAGSNGEEIRSIALSQAGLLYAVHISAGPTGGTSDNLLSSNSTSLTNNYFVTDGYTLEEYGGFYAEDQNTSGLPPESFHGLNAIMCLGNFIYTYDGQLVFVRNVSNGSFVDSLTIPGGIKDYNSGIVADSCGNIFVGTQFDIRMYDPTLHFIASTPLPGPVYDIAPGSNGNLYVCGNGFVAALNMPCNTPPAVLQITSSENGTCASSCTGSATATVNGGTPPYTYSWSPSGGTNATANGLCPGIYTCSLHDGAGNNGLAYFNIATTPGPSITSTSIFNDLCHGDQTGQIQLFTSSGTTNYTYSWSPVAGNTNFITNLGAGQYTCYITDAGGGCPTVVVDTIRQPALLSLSALNDSICPGQSAVLSAHAGGGTSPYLYSWSNGVSDSTQTVSPSVPATYTATVTDINGCTQSSTAQVLFRSLPAGSLSSNAVNGQLLLNAAPSANELCVNYTGPGNTLVWTFEGVSFTAMSSLTCFTLGDSGNYCAHLRVSDQHGCSDTSYLCVHAIRPSYNIPNVFTPNGDGKNDVFRIRSTGMKSLHCTLYDRWGRKIYEWEGINGYWDGQTSGGILASDGTYYYVADLVDENDKSYREAGFVQLIH